MGPNWFLPILAGLRYTERCMLFLSLRLLTLINTQVCASRLRTRKLFIQWLDTILPVFHSDEHRLLGTQHPTIKNPEDALSILDRFSSQYRAPAEDEGYNRIIYLQPSEQEEVYSRSTLATILERIRDAPSVTSVGRPASQPPTWGSPYSRGSFRGDRGRGRGGHNVNHAGNGGAGNSPTRGVNRWAMLSGQRETERLQNESAPEPPSGGDSNSSEARTAE
jgi:hypothetical protein